MPLAETVPAGLAGNIQDPVIPAVARDGDDGDAPVPTIGHQRTGERGTEAERPVAAVREVSAAGLGGTGAGSPERAAAERHVAQRGAFP